ncbi:hypothetical protein ACVIHD_006188 [Bradyrhizobium embrapense]
MGMGLTLERGTHRPALRRGIANAATALLFGLVALVASLAPANAWWNDEWSMRKKITVDVSATGANVTDPIGSAPVLVRCMSETSGSARRRTTAAICGSSPVTTRRR